MKIIRYLLLVFSIHTALAATVPYYCGINTTKYSTKITHLNTIQNIITSNAHVPQFPDIRSEQTRFPHGNQDRPFLCDFSRTEQYPSSAGDILVRVITAMPSDITRISTYPVEHLNETMIFAGITTALLITDRKTTWYVQNKVESSFDINPPRLFNLSLIAGTDSYIVAGLGALYVGSLAVGSEKGQAAALLSYKSIAYSVLFTHIILKTVTARKRPFDPLEGPEEVEEPYTRNQFDFFNFHRPYVKANVNATSFPSFHFAFLSWDFYLIYTNFDSFTDFCINYTLRNFIISGIYSYDILLHLDSKFIAKFL